MPRGSSMMKCIALLLLVVFVSRSDQYVLQQQRQNSRAQQARPRFDHSFASTRQGEHISSSSALSVTASHSTIIETTNSLNAQIAKLCEDDAIDDAVKLLDRAEDALMENNGNDFAFPSEASYRTILDALATSYKNKNATVLRQITGFFARLQQVARQFPMLAPTTRAYNAVLSAYAKSYNRDAGTKCVELLEMLWGQYNATDDDKNYCPTHTTYVETLTALARSGGNEAAEQAEELLEEMERCSSSRDVLSHLRPTTTCVNIVLHAWCKSGARTAAERCEHILHRMEELYFIGGRTELKPDVISYNTVLDALAQSRIRGSERRAEQLLEHMDELSTCEESWCRPDQYSFNSVLNGWARSREPEAARRADAILRHMEQRYAKGDTEIQPEPDVVSYNTVMTAWARSKSGNTRVKMVEQVLRRMENAYRRGNTAAHPNTISYNILISALAKSKDPAASDRAIEVLDQMQKLDSENGQESCRPDCVSYTTLINVFAKKTTGQKEAAEKAIILLEELEDAYLRTGDEAFKPNIRTYTAVIHAISRSRTDPERAERIMERLENLFEAGDNDFQPDCVCYDALLNTIGWSDTKGKALKCYSIYQKMMDLYRSGRNVYAKPDIITCNAVLNACAYEKAESKEESNAIIDVAVKTLEDFQSSAPEFGWPNHITYSTTLQVIHNHVRDAEKRADLAEATFWQCCQNGHVSVPVVTSLHRALTPWQRFAGILGEALCSEENESLHFNLKRLPPEWTRYAPSPKERRHSRPSQKPRPPGPKPSTIRHRQGK